MVQETVFMDLDFTPEQQAFRADIRAWVAANLPQDIAHKVHNGLRLPGTIRRFGSDDQIIEIGCGEVTIRQMPGERYGMRKRGAFRA